MKQKVRILLPCYNEEQNLPKLLTRVGNLAEQMPYIALEVVIVNDGSKDKCSEICDHYATKDARIQIIHKQNEGD